MNAYKILPLILFALPVAAIAEDFQPRLVPAGVNLVQLQKQETAGRTPEEVREMNRRELRSLPSEVPFEAVYRSSFRNLIRSHNFHPIIGPEVVEDYQQSNTSIGYCFGRAYYFHRSLKMLGVTDRAIKKAWIVGKIGKNWEFHVATIVRGEDGEWYALDTLSDSWASGVTVKDWYESWMEESSATTRLYITDADKFTASLGTYDPVQLGYGLDRRADWYKNYFIDLDFWFDSQGAMPYFRKMGLN